MSFRGFGPDALPFLKALAFHQTREWFEANKSTYESDLKIPMGDLIEELAVAFARVKIPLKGDRKNSLFRIHRDVRFAKDKSPYKTQVGAVMTRRGVKNDPGLFYFHVAPEGCFAAAGFYDPTPDSIATFRARMTGAPKSWKQTVSKLAKADLALSADYALKRNPRGFEAIEDEEIAAGVKLKSIVVTRPTPARRIAEPELVEDLIHFVRDAMPLLTWGWDALADPGPA